LRQRGQCFETTPYLLARIIEVAAQRDTGGDRSSHAAEP
jgi:hypothetical protein